MSRPNFTKRTGIVPKIKAVDVDFLTDTRLSGRLIFFSRIDWFFTHLLTRWPAHRLRQIPRKMSLNVFFQLAQAFCFSLPKFGFSSKYNLAYVKYTSGFGSSVSWFSNGGISSSSLKVDENIWNDENDF